MIFQILQKIILPRTKTLLLNQNILEIVQLKNSSRVGQLKDYRKYISSNDVEKLHDNLLKIYEC